MFIQEFDVPGPGGSPGLHVGIWREQHSMTMSLPAFNQSESKVNKTDEFTYKIHVKNMNPTLWCLYAWAVLDGITAVNATHPTGVPSTEVLDPVDPGPHAAMGKAMTQLPNPPWNTVALEGSDLRHILFTPLAPLKDQGAHMPPMMANQAVSGLRLDLNGMDLPAYFQLALTFNTVWAEKLPEMKKAEPRPFKIDEKIID